MKTLRYVLAFCLAYSFLGMAPARAEDTFASKAGQRLNEPDAPTGGTVNTCTLAALQTALSGGGTVTFNCSGTIVFTSTWVVTANTTINGNGFGVILSGGNATDLFSINSGAKLTLSRLTIQNGLNTSSGGCIRAFGDLDVISSTIRFCKAAYLIGNPNGGAIYANNALVQLTNTLIFSNSAEGVGGGVYAVGGSDVRVVQSTIQQNAGSRGGGVYQDTGTAIFTSSNVLSNTAATLGGGVYASRIPTFLFEQSALSYNHVSSNTAGIGGGAYFTVSTSNFTNADIIGNESADDSGGVYNGGASGALSIYSSVISGNIASGSPGGVRSEGNSATLYNNLFQNNNGYPYGGAFRNSSYANTGGNTFINNHGYYGGGIYNDAGKQLQIYETTFISNTAAYGGAIRNDGIIDYGIGITFTGNTVPYRGGAFYSENSSARTNFDRVTVTHNSADLQEGGAFYINLAGNALTLTHALIANNLTGLHGAGIYSKGARVRVENSQINDNTHKNITNTSSGMAVYATGPANTYLSGVDVYRNHAAYLAQGGALHLEGDAVVLHAKINDNSMNGSGYGGGIYFLNANAEVHFSELNNNTGAYGGGAIYTENSTLFVDQSEMQANEASGYGGGIDVFQTTLNLFDVVIRNHASGLSDGGGIDCYGCTGTWQYLTLKSNTAMHGGGADFYQSQVNILSSLFETNSAIDGAGLRADDSTIFITNTTFSGNIASGNGGGVYGRRGSAPTTAISMTNVTFKNNGAVSGGNLFLESDSGAAKAEARIRNTVLADPASGGNCGGKPINAAFYSLSTDFTCLLTSLSATNKADGTPASLGQLWFNGGYAKSHMPLAGSALIDGVLGPVGPTTDQRNASRPVGLGFDIGAVEYGSNAVFFVDAFRNFVPNTARSFGAGW